MSGRGGPAGAGPPLPPRLHVVTDSSVLADRAFPVRAEAVLRAGGDGVALHVRGPATSGREVHERLLALLPVARVTGGRLLVNDRVDVALVTEEVGVHLAARSLPIGETRALVGPARTLGASVHDGEAAERAAADGANFVFVGNVFATATHPGRAGMGTAELARICGRVPRLPVMAIGGVRPEHVQGLAGAGAYGAAVLGGVWSRPDAGAAIEEYLEAMTQAFRPIAEER